eukprot:109113_1
MLSKEAQDNDAKSEENVGHQDKDQKNDDSKPCGGIEHCLHLSRFTETMQKYNEYHLQMKGTMKIIDGIDISETTDDFIHLIHKHDNGEAFEFILSKLPQCNIKICRGFRNYRDRTKCDNTKHDCGINLGILDKIHCYFAHSYDIGHRLNTHEAKEIENDIKQQNDTCIDDDINSINQKMLKMKQISFHTRNINKETMNSLNERISTKNTQLIYTSVEPISNSNTLDFGHEIHYHGGADCCDQGVSPKYNSLKEELITNKFSRLNIQQFDSEYKKALVHFNTRYCKQRVKPNYYDTIYEDYPYEKYTLAVHHILSLMVYCNYTHLQCEFSKTYRSGQVINDTLIDTTHDEFYHLGYNIKIAVHEFGTKIRDGRIKRLYHGLSSVLLLSKYMDHTNCAFIYCPLSTTSSMEVALHFAANDGMVVELGAGEQPTHELDGMPIETQWMSSPTKYFSVQWLSDYASEREFLFVQNDDRRLMITNITHTATAVDYMWILEALKCINLIISVGLPHPLMVTRTEKNATNILSIIHQLSMIDASYEKCKHIDQYGEELIKGCFCNTFQEEVVLKYKLMNKSRLMDSVLKQMLGSRFGWNTIEKALKIFPNANKFVVMYCDWDEGMVEGILHGLSDMNNQSKVNQILLFLDESNAKVPNTKLELSVEKYRLQFAEVGYTLDFFGGKDTINIEKNS